MCIIRASPPLNEITAQTRLHGSFSQSLPLHFPAAAKGRPQMAGRGEQRRIENLQVGRLFIFLPEADVSLCNFIQLRSVYLSHRVNTDVERRREMNSPVPQRAPLLLCQWHEYEKRKKRAQEHVCVFFSSFFSSFCSSVAPLGFSSPILM